MAKTASNNGRKNTSQSRKTNTQGKKTTAQGRKKQTKKNVQTQADQLKNDCIILFSIACAIIMVLSNFNIAGTLGRGIKWLMFGLFGVMEYIFPVILAVSIIFLMVNRELLRQDDIDSLMEEAEDFYETELDNQEEVYDEEEDN